MEIYTSRARAELQAEIDEINTELRELKESRKSLKIEQATIYDRFLLWAVYMNQRKTLKSQRNEIVKKLINK